MNNELNKGMVDLFDYQNTVVKGAIINAYPHLTDNKEALAYAADSISESFADDYAERFDCIDVVVSKSQADDFLKEWLKNDKIEELLKDGINVYFEEKALLSRD